MKRHIFISILFFGLATFVLPAQKVEAEKGWGKIPLYFIPNKGQVSAPVQFYTRTPAYILGITNQGLTFEGTYLTFVGAGKNPDIVPLHRTQHRVNYFKGKDPSGWCKNIPSFTAVLYRNLYKNINLRIYGKHNRIEYDWIIKRGGKPGDIKLKYSGTKQTFIDGKGNLVIETAEGRFLHRKPVSFQVINGQRQEIESYFTLIKTGTYGFRVKEYNKNYDLIIDPYVLYYSTYLGGSGDDGGYGIAVDSSGCAYICGETDSLDFLTENPFQGNFSGGSRDIFITKFSSNGDALEYSTYMGGSNWENVGGIAVDSTGSAYVVGDTASSDFPTHVPFQGASSSYRDAFVVKLSSTGDALVYATYLGGFSVESGNGIAVDASGSAYITGSTESKDFPTRNAFQEDYAWGYSDAFVAKFSPTGDSLVYSTYLGGEHVKSSFFGDMGFDIAVDSNGYAYVTGITYSEDFPVLNAYQYSKGGPISGFVTKFSTAGDSLVYSTYLGGSGLDFCEGIAVDSTGCAYVCGYSDSTDFPTLNAFQNTPHGYDSAFITKFSPTGSSLVYSTLLGGNSENYAFDIAVDSSGSAYVTGGTWSTDFPTLNPYQQDFSGGESDAFFAKLSPTGDSLLYSSYLGGNEKDDGESIAIDNSGKVYLTGSTSSPDFPLIHPLQDTPGADTGSDAFVTKLIFTDITAYQLNVRSTGITSVPITVTPTDYLGETNGSTNFTRTYAAGTVVTITAPQSYNQTTFLKWVKGGSEYTSPSIQLTMTGNRTAEAVYKTPAKISLDRNKLTFGAIDNGVTTGLQQFTINNTGDEDMNWTLSVNQPWLLNCTPTSGTNAGVVTVSVDPTGFYPTGNEPESYQCRIAIHANNASNSPQIVIVHIKVYKPGSTSVPFGTFETPTSGSTIRSSVPFTGWVLDDIGVEHVKIYNGNTYIDDAVLVEGARPDVEQAYPGYPMNYRAGWGYMMLTNFLPNGGNGTYTFHAIAMDKEGNQKTLGSKTVTIDNAHAVNPFGAIDTPKQGGTASGNNFINWGWVLTPQPNSIPVDGSTISVWVDGVNIGHPTYNNYRADIASLFPGYANSNGAVGYFYLDTTMYKNGLHTIQWTARDSSGNTDGIGSMYFAIQNTSSDGKVSLVNNQWSSGNMMLSEIPVDYFTPVKIRKGYNENIKPKIISPTDNGIISIRIKELQRIEVQLDKRDEVEVKAEQGLDRYLQRNPLTRNTKQLTLKNDSSNRFTGFMLVGHILRPLPVGSTIDPIRGAFYWQLGPGFIGRYRLVFLRRDRNSYLFKIPVEITIVPRF
jgi:hypothetical protein